MVGLVEAFDLAHFLELDLSGVCSVAGRELLREVVEF